MLPVFLHDRITIAQYLSSDPFLHLYELGDLDDFFWPYTSWIAYSLDEVIQALILIYVGGGLPVVLAIEEKNSQFMRDLMEQSANQPLFPRKFYTHLSPGLADILKTAGYQLHPHGRYLKMGLKDRSRLLLPETMDMRRLTVEDEFALRKMYAEAYPANWFDSRMLETGCFFGIDQNHQIISAAGIHVFSPQYRAAALGNICTHPAHRGRGLGMQVTAALCQHLAGQVDIIGLNVKEDNTSALSIYTRLGFETVAVYEEYMVEAA